MSTYSNILATRAKLADVKKQYLRRFGWESTCNTPGSYWLWRRDFSDIDKQRRVWWEKHRAPAGQAGPSEPIPMGFVTADTDMAVDMTMDTLDPFSDEPGEIAE